MTAGTTPYRSALPGGPDRFRHLLHAEWTKLRTVPGWVAGLVAAALLTVLFGVLAAAGMPGPCAGGAGGPAGGAADPGDVRAAEDGAGGAGDAACTPPVGPGGETVNDSFYFVHQPLEGDGSITVRITSLTGLVPADDLPDDGGPPAMEPGVEPWAKAGLIVREDTGQGSPYAAVMVTGDHGVRMQHDYVHDTAGGPGGVDDDSPRWLRLTRSGDTLTGHESTDGRHWTEVATVHLDDLPATVEAGLFVASPSATHVDDRPFGLSASGGPTRGTGVFDQVDLVGSWPRDGWRGDHMGDDPVTSSLGEMGEDGGRFTLSGSGDIGPAVGGQAFGSGRTIEQSLVGTFPGLIAVVVVATMFVTAEYRRGLMATTLTAGPRRGRALAAKALVIGGVTFAVALAAAVASVVVGERMARSGGPALSPVGTLTVVRVMVGTAALLAVAAVFALAVGVVLRRSAAAITAVVGLIVLPYILATASVLPGDASDWLLRLTPAAAFSIQQTLPVYHQVSNLYVPANGYYPLAPWAGFAVLGAYAVAALALAARLLHRRDA